MAGGKAQAATAARLQPTTDTPSRTPLRRKVRETHPKGQTPVFMIATRRLRKLPCALPGIVACRAIQIKTGIKFTPQLPIERSIM
jgi:hypothetical protein